MQRVKLKKMNKLLLIACLLISANNLLFAQKNSKAVAVIFDSDMGPDYDDVGAITLLHAFADRGKARILATMASTKYPGVAAVLNTFNTYFKKPKIPVGVPKGWALELRDTQHWSDSVIANYPHAIKQNDDAEDAIVLYRKILAAQPDNSVTIITVGFLTNLDNLLKSQPDKYSPLDGMALVKKKVAKLVSMAGKFPSGNEFNIDRHPEASKNVFENWPTPVVFSGFEIGEKIKCGLPLIHNEHIKNSPVKDVFRISIPMAAEDSAGRMSWDETAVLVAVLGSESYYSLQCGKISVDAKTGANTWANDNKSNQCYLVEKAKPEVVQNLINNLMMHQPR